MLKVNLDVKGIEELKISRCLEKFGKETKLRYSVISAGGNTHVEFFVYNIGARNEILRRFRHFKNLEIVSIETRKVFE